MGPGDTGVFDLEDKHATIRVGNGKQLEIAKIGKRKGTIIQSDGSEVQIIMKQYKQVPGLWCNLFSAVHRILCHVTQPQMGLERSFAKDSRWPQTQTTYQWTLALP
jgi:hypothetical protein